LLDTICDITDHQLRYDFIILKLSLSKWLSFIILIDVILLYYRSRIKFMMNTEELLSAEQVLINPLNRSTSKQQYSFPKANRFATSKTDHSDDHFYDMPSTKSRIASSIGKERRTTFDNKNGFLPAPNNYTYRVDG